MNIRSLGFVNGIAIIFVTVVASTALAPSVRADHAENAFVIVEGEGVVRLDGKNFAVITSVDAAGKVFSRLGKGKGIRCVAETIAHEQGHIDHYALTGRQLDSDGDGIANSLEFHLQGIKTLPDNADSCNIGEPDCGDDEVRCQKIEVDSPGAYYENFDWANPGCQSKNKFGPL